MIEALLLMEVAVFLIGFSYIFKRERIFGVYYLFLFVYGIFAQVGYIYVPELSVLISAYFGAEIWIPSTRIIILSLALIFLLFAFCWKKIVILMPLTFSVRAQKILFLEKSAIIFLIAIVCYQALYLILNIQDINWYTNQDEDFRSDNVAYALFLFLFKFSVAINIVLYAIVRDRLGAYARSIYVMLFSSCLCLFLFIAFRLGNRTDLLAFALGSFVYHLYRDGFDFRKFIKITGLAFLLFVILYFIETARYKDDGLQLDFWASIIAKDWYAPAHILFAAVRYEVIDPIEVLTSNISNSLIMIGYPYLQYGVTEIFNPGVATRSAGYAFYILTEGYMFMGEMGFVYNAVLIVFGFAAWKKFASTENKYFNNFLLGLMGCLLVNLVRGQGSYFIKYFYTFVIPGVYLYAALSGQSLVFKIKKTISFNK